MKAVIQEGFGSPEEVLRLGEIAQPVPRDDEVLVRVRAASVHADVWHMVTGRPYVMRLMRMGAGLRRPKDPVPGTDLAGEVVAVGKDVTRFQAGDAVFGEGFREYSWKNGGTFAEYAAVPQDTLALKPDGVSFEEASTVPTSGIIALTNLRDDRIKPGHRVLVNGAGGAVGSIAVQLAKASGAHVTGVDCTEKLELLRSLGADCVVDYTREDFTSSGQRYDVILDVASTLSLAACKDSLTPDGIYILIGHDHFGRKGRRFLGSFPPVLKWMLLAKLVHHLPVPGSPLPSKGECVETLRELLAEGMLTPVIDRTFPLSQAADAIRYLAEGNPRGRIVVQP